MATPKIVPTDDCPAEIIADAICEIANAMQVLSKSRLKREAVVALIHDTSGIAKGTIRLVLNNLDHLEQTWPK